MKINYGDIKDLTLSEKWGELNYIKNLFDKDFIINSQLVLKSFLIASIYSQDFEFIDQYLNYLKEYDDESKIVKSVILFNLGEFDQALEILENIESNIENDLIISNIYKNSERYKEALKVLSKYNNFATNTEKASIKDLTGRYKESLILMEKAYNENKFSDQIKFNLSLKYLQNKNYSKGWELYESRMNFTQLDRYKDLFDIVKNRKDLTRERVVLFCEQGLGDYIQFIRYAHILYTINPKIMLYNIEENNLIGDIKVLNKVDIDVKMKGCSIMSIPYLLGLKEPITIKSKKTKKIEKVGACWTGSPYNSNDRFRSFYLKEFKNISKIKNITLYSIQQNYGTKKYFHKGDEINYNDSEPFHIIDCSNHLQSIQSSIDLISNLDLVITADTFIAHLAGSLGINTWVLLNDPIDWRWGLDSKNDWYESVRLYRKKYNEPWSKLFKKVEKDIKNLNI